MTTIHCSDSKSSCNDVGGKHHTTLILPVAPRASCRIRFDPIDSPARAVPPRGALNWLEENLQHGAKIKNITIEGPGEPLCDMDCTMETLRLIAHKYPDISLSVTTLGIHTDHVQPLVEAGVTCVTLLVDAVKQNIADKLYAWVRPGQKTIPLAQGTEMLIKEQQRTIEAFKQAGCTITIRSTVYPGFNDDHIEEIAKVMTIYGADAMTLAPYKPTASKTEQLLNTPALEIMQGLQKRAAKHLPTLLPAEKDERIGLDCPSLHGACKAISLQQPRPTKTQPNVAVVSSNGMEIDLHLGQAYQVLIYGPREDGLPCLLTTRAVPEPDNGSSRWEELAELLDDCFALLTASAGESPRRILGDHGITVLITDNEIEGTVDVLFGGGKKDKCKK